MRSLSKRRCGVQDVGTREPRRVVEHLERFDPLEAAAVAPTSGINWCTCRGPVRFFAGVVAGVAAPRPPEACDTFSQPGWDGSGWPGALQDVGRVLGRGAGGPREKRRRAVAIEAVEQFVGCTVAVGERGNFAVRSTRLTIDACVRAVLTSGHDILGASATSRGSGGPSARIP